MTEESGFADSECLDESIHFIVDEYVEIPGSVVDCERGMAAGVEYDLMAYLVSRYFGLKHYAAIYGALYAFFALGAGVGPYIYGAAYEASGSYDRILILSSFLFIAGALPILFLGKYRDFVRGDRE